MGVRDFVSEADPMLKINWVLCVLCVALVLLGAVACAWHEAWFCSLACTVLAGAMLSLWPAIKD